jgi:hypothetical protein
MIPVYGLMKHKTTGVVTQSTAVPISRQYNLYTGVFTGVSFGGDPLEVLRKEDSIKYTNRVKAFPLRANWCIHSKVARMYYGAITNAEIIDTGSGVKYDFYEHHREALNYHPVAAGLAMIDHGENLGTTALSTGAQAYINEAARRLRPDLTTMSVPNFLLEIGEISQLMKLWNRTYGLARNVAGLHLNYNFGWKPTIGDVEAMVNAITGFQKKLADFLKETNKVLHRHTVIEKKVKTGSGIYVPPIGYGLRRDVYWKYSLSKTISAHVVYKPQPLKVMGEYEFVVRSLLDSLGFELNPRIIWDRLPFSFVVDWFFGVGRFLETFKYDTLELPIQYVDSYLQYSQKYSFDSDTVCVPNTNGISQSGWNSGTWSDVDNLFHRMPIFPETSSLTDLGWKVPTTKQATLLVSLATVLRK